MVIDHVGAVFCPDVLWLRALGRASFPVFAWFVVRGVRRSGSLWKYAFRILACAALGQVAYAGLLGNEWLNGLFAFALWVALEAFWQGLHQKYRATEGVRSCLWLGAALLYYGICMMALFTHFRPKSPVWWSLWTLLQISVLFTESFSWIQILVLPLPLWLDRIREDRARWNWGYAFYPAHLTLLWIIRSNIR